MLPQSEQDEMLAELSQEELLYDSGFWLRPSQLLPIERGLDWDLGVLQAGRGAGKLITLSTPVPVPGGWSTMGALRAGDEVFDEAGRVCTVLAAHAVEVPKRAYRLTFSDGTWVDAGGEHLWVTWNHRERELYLKWNRGATDYPDDWPTYRQPVYAPRGVRVIGEVGPSVRDTDELYRTQIGRTRKDGRIEPNHMIPLCGALDLPTVRVPLDPYVLGLWVGNGVIRSGRIIAGSKDGDYDGDHYAALLASAGLSFNRTEKPDLGVTLFYVYDILGILRGLGIFDEKVIPDQYMRGSIDQRWALLRGLMDTDGNASGVSAQVTFTTTSEKLAHQVVELARSLGERPVLRPTEYPTFHGEPAKPRYRVQWSVSCGIPFALPRKAQGIVFKEKRKITLKHRILASINPIEPVPMRCITVDSPNSMYLVGEGMIPTHNTRVLSEWIRHKVKTLPAGSRGALVARTSADVRDVLVNGISGIMACSPPDERPTWESSKRLLTFPNGTTMLAFSSESPDTLRGPQFNFAVADEISAWLYLPDESGLTAWSNLRLATRLGDVPQILAATTPRRTPFMQDLIKQYSNPRTLLIRGSTRDNELNLSKTYLDVVYGLYAGTRLAAQELEGELLEDAENALWSQEMFDSFRYDGGYVPDHALRIVAVDPSVADKPRDECGIIVAGATAERELMQRQAFVLDDRSLLGSPAVWAQAVVDAAHDWSVSVVVAEGNQGGELVANSIKAIDPALRVVIVHARVDKRTRAEPVSLRYEKGRVHHCGVFPLLESQCTTWDPTDKRGKSPDRLDSLVWAITALLIKPPSGLLGGVLRSSGGASRRQIPAVRVPVLGGLNAGGVNDSGARASGGYAQRVLAGSGGRLGVVRVRGAVR